MSPTGTRVRSSLSVCFATGSADIRSSMHVFALRTFIILLAICVLAPGPVLHAQAESEQADAEFPEAFAIAGRSRAMADSAARVEADLARLSDLTSLESELEEMRERLENLTALIAATEVEYVRPERLSRIRDRAVQHEQRLKALYDRTSDRLQAAQEVRIAWEERRDYWRSWRDNLVSARGTSAVDPELQRAMERIESVVAQVGSVIPSMLSTQREAARLRTEAEDLAAQVATVRAARQGALTERAAPALFSPAFLSELATLEWRPSVVLRRTGLAGFIAPNLVLLLVHVLLVGAVVLIARRLRRIAIPADAWSGLLRRPLAFGIFAATTILAGRYLLAPALWDVLMWALLAGSGATLATSLLRTRSARVVLYLLAVLYPLFLLAEALQIPSPLFRMGLAGIAFAGLAGFGIALRRELKKLKPDAGALVLLGLGLLMWTVVLAATIAGYFPLARWVLHATVTSAYVLFLVVFLMVVARGGVQTLLRVEAKGRLSFLRTVGVPVVERLLRLLLVALVVVATLIVLDTWGISPSPLETWQRITSVGVTIGGVHIALDRVLLAGVMVYLIVLLSWALRAFARSEVYPRWELERGVGESMNALLRYVLILVAILIGLGTLGVELQNFAILAGALGIGIGFGLQNIVNNFVSGLILLFERPVRVGDTVVIDEEFGTIQKIGLRSTTVLRVDQSEVIVPNGDLVSEKVVNWTLSNPVARLLIPVGVAYGTRVARVLEILEEAAVSNPDVMDEPPPQALFTGFGDSSLDFEIRVWVQELRQRLIVRSAILAEIDRRFAEEGIEIPFPQRDLHVRSVDPGVVERLRSEGPTSSA